MVSLANLHKSKYNVPNEDNSLIITKQQENYGGVSNKVIYKTDKLQLQRWNNIILNYQNGTLDVFINKKLVLQINFTLIRKRFYLYQVKQMEQMGDIMQHIIKTQLL